MSGFVGDVIKAWTKYRSSYLAGVKNTLILAFVGTVFGCLIGFLCGILQTIPYTKNDNAFKKGFLKLIRGIIRVYVELFRGTPMILQAVFFYYGLPYVTGGSMKWSSVWLCAILVVSINSGAYRAETVRGCILSVDKGQTEGAKAIGMNHWQTMRYVIMTQVLKNILPQIGNNYLINVKDTSVMFIITFSEFFAVHRAVTGATYMYFPSAVIEMIGYLCMTLTASVILRFWEKHLAGSSSYSLATDDQLAPTAGMLNSPLKGSNFDEHHKEGEQHGTNY